MTDNQGQSGPVGGVEQAPANLRKQLEQAFNDCQLVRSFRRACYDAGDTLVRDITGVVPANKGQVTLQVERLVGGGFAGQVYRVKLIDINCEEGPIEGLEVGKIYAIKILRPPSAFSCVFRDFLYMLAYQGAFSAQVNPDAVRVGVLWQKLIRRAASFRLGADDAVADTYATFYDQDLHSFGEINEWVTGRVWKFEVDDQLFNRWDFEGDPPDDVNSPEYIHKKIFMQKLVAMLHEMGAPELARQYEWWTCKSQPNALKRLSAGDDPKAGVTAIDFRAGLALLPFVPMSPADFWLIIRGLRHGRLVQFDRSDPEQFQRFIDENRDKFEDLTGVIDELKEKEPIFRSSLPDITHHRFRLITDKNLRESVKQGTLTAWRSLGRIDQEHSDRLARGKTLFRFLFLLSFIPLLGPSIVKIWGSTVRRQHIKGMFTSGSYLWRAMRGARIEALIQWQRKGRLSDERAQNLVRRPVRFWLQRILVGWMPPTWHRFLTEPAYALQRVKDSWGFTWSFLRNPTFREEWLLEQVELGRNEGMLSDEEAKHVSDQIKDPFIQKYLRCVAVHACTVPVTQIVMLIAGVAVGAYYYTALEAGWGAAVGMGTVAAMAIQLMPISPGSISRGIFVLYLMIRERDIKNYYIAAPVSFLHVIGYLAFPLQMVAHDPALARYMAGRWAKTAVHMVPVFGESGALLEHFIFDVFFNLPLVLKRRMKQNPIISGIIGAIAGSAIVAAVGYVVYVGCWEWTQPLVQLDDAVITSISDPDDDNVVHFTVTYKDQTYPLDFTESELQDTDYTTGDEVDGIIRKAYSGESYDVFKFEPATTEDPTEQPTEETTTPEPPSTQPTQ